MQFYANSIKDLSTQKSSRKQKNDEDNGIMLFNRGITIKNYKFLNSLHLSQSKVS